MTDVLTALPELSTAVKVGWIVWLVWMGVAIAWYRRARTSVPPLMFARSRAVLHRMTPMARDAAASGEAAPLKTVVAPPAKPAGSPDFVAALDRELQQRAAASAADATGQSVYH